MDREFRTILAMDVVGFSKMMSKNEELTLNILTNRRQMIDEIINKNDGKIFNRKSRFRILRLFDQKAHGKFF